MTSVAGVGASVGASGATPAVGAGDGADFEVTLAQAQTETPDDSPAGNQERGVVGDVLAGTGAFGQSLWDNVVVGTVEGVVGIGRGAYSLATSGEARQEFADTAGAVADNVGGYVAENWDQPGAVLDDVVAFGQDTYERVETAYDEAEARGETAEFFGAGLGIVVGEVLPTGRVRNVTRAVDAADTLGDVARLADNVGDAARLADDAGDAARVADNVGDAARGADNVGDAARVADDAGDAARTADRLDDAARQIDGASYRRFDAPDANGAVRALSFSDVGAFNRAANDALPNTRYEFGGYAWTTDAQGRVSVAEGRVSLGEVQPRSGLQTDIGNGQDALPTDIGFHILGHQFGGPTNMLNVVPGNGRRIDGDAGADLRNLNNGAYADFERTIRNAANDPDNTDVRVRVEVSYPEGNPTMRPNEFNATLTIDGIDVQRTFVNKPVD